MRFPQTYSYVNKKVVVSYSESSERLVKSKRKNNKKIGNIIKNAIRQSDQRECKNILG